MEGVYSIKTLLIQEGSMELHMRENCILFLPVNITHGVACQLS